MRKWLLWEVHIWDTPIFTDVIGDFTDFAPGVPAAWFREFIMKVNGVHELYSVRPVEIN